MTTFPDERSTTVLVVDDTPANIPLLEKPLLRAGYHVLVANGGPEALETVKNNDIDIVLMDWVMPEMDGLAVCREMKNDPKLSLIPVIMVTTRDKFTDLKEALEAGADDYVNKPADIVELMARMKAALRQRWLKKSLDDSNEMLKRHMELKDEFLNIVSHDLRSPLNSIIGLTGMVLDDSDCELDDSQRRNLELVKKAGEYQLQLVNNLLDLTKIETGNEVLNLIARPVGGLLRDCVRMMRFDAESKGIELRLDVGYHQPLDLDDLKIRRVVNNLLSNAIKFTPPGGTVDLSCMEDMEGNGACRVTVKDSGVGIKQEELPRLFGKFARISSKATAGEKGPGLGLSICKQIVELHNGRIWVESDEGKGTTFSFTIPVGLDDQNE